MLPSAAMGVAVRMYTCGVRQAFVGHRRTEDSAVRIATMNYASRRCGRNPERRIGVGQVRELAPIPIDAHGLHGS